MTVSWLTPAAAAPVIRLHPETVRDRARTRRLHGHNDREGERTGQWWFNRHVLELVAVWPAPIHVQVARCGCSRPGFTPPPSRAGFARRASP